MSQFFGTFCYVIMLVLVTKICFILSVMLLGDVNPHSLSYFIVFSNINWCVIICSCALYKAHLLNRGGTFELNVYNFNSLPIGSFMNVISMSHNRTEAVCYTFAEVSLLLKHCILNLNYYYYFYHDCEIFVFYVKNPVCDLF